MSKGPCSNLGYTIHIDIPNGDFNRHDNSPFINLRLVNLKDTGELNAGGEQNSYSCMKIWHASNAENVYLHVH